MSNMSATSLQPGEINLGLVPVDWPLTPIGDNKNPYLLGWQNKPQTIEEIKKEIEKGTCKGIGLISGPVYNEPYGLVWVDVDGPTVYDTIKIESGLTIETALPKTLTILSGREGRERKLYKVLKKDWKKFIRNKYQWHANGEREKLEVLWKRHQGVLMGFHPDTDGYFTKPDEDFQFVNQLPEIPGWILKSIEKKNNLQGRPAEGVSRTFGPNFAFNSKIGLDRTIKEAKEALWKMPPEAADDYDIWIAVGQSLHSADDSLLEEWDEWSKQSDKYQNGECQRRWESFTKGGGITLGTLFHHAKDYGWTPNQDYRAMGPDDDLLDEGSKLLEKFLNDINVMAVETKENKQPFQAQKENNVLTTEPSKKGKGRRNASKHDVTRALIRTYQGNLLFDPIINRFVYYDWNKEMHGLWETMEEVEMRNDIWKRLESFTTQENSLLPNGFDRAYVKDMYDSMADILIERNWEQDPNKVLFSNGIFNIVTREFRPVRKEDRMRHALHFPYNEHNKCPLTIQWLTFTQYNDEERVQLLRAWMRAVLVGAHNVQRFLEVVGPGKSGKSSFMTLCHALVGRDNAAVSNLDRLEKNRFGLSSVAGKKLLMFNDVERYGGNVANLKAIVGGDEVVAEHKFGGEEKFVFKGMVMMTANEQIATTDATSGLQRRRLTIPFDRVFRGSVEEQVVLIAHRNDGTPYGKLAHELPGIVNWLLEMPEKDMCEYLIKTNEKVAYYKETSTKQLTRSNNIIDWLHHNTIFVPNAKSIIGDAKPAPKDALTFYASSDQKLYANYCEFCRNNNVGMQARSRFDVNLLDILNHQLSLNIYKNDKRTVSLFNIRIRQIQMDDHYPSIVDLALNPDKYRDIYGDVQIRYGSKK